jgi:hypothetical protein
VDAVVEQGAQGPWNGGRDGERRGERLGLGAVDGRVAAGAGLAVGEAEELHGDEGDEGSTDEGGDGLERFLGGRERREREGGGGVEETETSRTQPLSVERARNRT